MMKKILSLVLIFLMQTLLFACGNEVSDNSKINIVCTTFAAYDWTRQIVGENTGSFDILLLGDGTDLHSFQPTTADIAKIHTADLFIQIGGTTEDWTNELNLDNKTLVLFDLLDEEEKLSVGNSHTYDEHIWLSLKLAQKITNKICDSICDLDRENGVNYQKNCAEYIQKLKQLDEEYRLVADNSKDKTVIFADRYPFAYLMRDYGIECISAFDGCSSDANASFDTITHLAEEIKLHGKDTVLVLEGSAESVAEPLKSALNARPLNTEVMNSCQSIDLETMKDIGYIDIMVQNLKSLKNALRG